MTDGLAIVPEQDTREQARQLAEQATANIGRIILGKDQEIRLALACLFARGHLLIEDVPGVGKTLLARSIAVTLGLNYQRIQFTSDMLPSDIIGVSVFEQVDATFRFHEGPLFSELVLADEINRATPKAQSALLEAMEEHQVTVDGSTHVLPEPFFVIATQNPMHQIGTFPLPESQLDRFLMRIGLGYPEHRLERKLLAGNDRRRMLDDLSPLLTHQDISAMQKARTRHPPVRRPARLCAGADPLHARNAGNRTGPVHARRPGPAERREMLGHDQRPCRRASGRYQERVPGRGRSPAADPQRFESS